MKKILLGFIMDGQVNAEVEDYVKQRLIDCQFKFRLEEDTGRPAHITSGKQAVILNKWDMRSLSIITDAA